MKKGAARTKRPHKKTSSKALTTYKKTHFSYPKKNHDFTNRQEYTHVASRKPTPWPQICPNSVFVSLRYVDCIQMDVAGAGFLTQVFSANGCYDPDDRFGGHQPYGWDQWAALYDQYMVESSKCVLTIQGHTGGENGASVVGIQLGGTSTISALSVETLMETDNSVHRLLDINNQVISKSYSKKQFFANRQMDNLQASVGSDPTELAHFIIWCNSVNAGVLDPARVTMVVDIYYNIVFSERARFGAS